MGQSESFHWLSPLGIGVGLFLAWGAFNVVIGVLAPVLLRAASDAVPSLLVISPRADAVVFGADPERILKEQTAVPLVQRLLWQWFAGVLIAFGAATIAITWFALRRGEAWALVVLAIAAVATLASAGLVLETYVRRGAPLGLGDIPPLFTTAAILTPPAFVLSWIGLVQR